MTEANWHILTVSRGGAVSLLKNLTEDLARATMQRLMPGGNPWEMGTATIRFTLIHETSYGNPADLIRVEAFGPENQRLDVWPKPADYDQRREAALAQTNAA